MNKPAIFDSFADIDILSQPAVVGVLVSLLEPGMVLVDPELGVPLVGIDARVRSPRNSGQQRFLVANLDGGWMHMNLSPSVMVKVVAA